MKCLGSRLVRWSALLALPILMLVGAEAFPSVAGAATSCASDVQHVEAGAKGPFRCKAAGINTIVVGAQTPLPLTSLRASFRKARTTHTLVEKVDGTVMSHATAKGVFVLVTIQVTNLTHKPQSFDDLGQTELQIGNSQYSVSTDGDLSDSGADGFTDDIQPGESSTGDIVFDVPNSALALFPKHAALLLVNFGDDVSFGSPSQVGVMYVG